MRAPYGTKGHEDSDHGPISVKWCRLQDTRHEEKADSKKRKKEELDRVGGRTIYTFDLDRPVATQ